MVMHREKNGWQERLGRWCGIAPRERRRRSAQRRPGLAGEALESRHMMAITVAGALPDLIVAPGGTIAPIDTTAQFSVTGVTVQGTVVEMATQAGTGSSVRNLFLELYDQAIPGRSAAPISTANFLSYVNSGGYDSSIFHRATDFAGDAGPAKFLQGGGFTADDQGWGTVATGSPINLEWAANRPNAQGTISYARTSDPNSATSGFFFNVVANPSFDAVGNQYAAFGRVVGDGQAILDAYAAFRRVNANAVTPAFATLPVSSVDGITYENLPERLVKVLSASVVASPATTFGLTATSSAPTIAAVVVDAAGKLQLAVGQTRGTATITVTGTDLSGASVQDTFTVAVGIPGIAVADGLTAITSAQAQAVGLVAAAVGTVAPSKTFTITNPGDVPLSITGVTLPAGVTLVGAAPTSVPAGGSANLVVALDTAAVRAVSGSIAIASSASATLFSIPVAGVVFGKPELPTRVVSAWGNGTKIILSWTAAVDNGSPVTRSDVYALLVGTTAWTKVADVAGTATSTEVFGLDITKAFAFKVASRNIAGFSRLSNDGVKYLMAPITPAAIVATAAGQGSASLTWQHAVQPWDGLTKSFRPLTGYVVFTRQVGTAAWTRSADIPVVTSTTVTGLVAGRNYQFALRAKSDSGGSLISKPSNSATL
jgi:cyclophilin family peptidyl-prolyl cis-trans isomerase